MDSVLPDRYQLQIRLGADGDVTEWLATDVSLDRPVLVRILGPEAPSDRHHEFLDGVRTVAAVVHTHLAAVYAVGSTAGTSYAVVEWVGGVSLADRMESGESIPLEDFLPNAAGLAAALAALHAGGATHGSIDHGAIRFSAAHPAKFSAYGRRRVTQTAEDDVRRLAHTLRTAIADAGAGGLLSGVAELLPPGADAALERAERGAVDAAGLSAELRAAPSASPPATARAWTWRSLVPIFALLAVAILLGGVGLALEFDPQSPLLFPAAPPQAADRPPGETSPTTTVADGGNVPQPVAFTVASYDPLGDGSEHDSTIQRAADGDPDTVWSTERYFDPLPLIKGGVGFVVTPDGSASVIEIVGTPQTAFRTGWASQTVDDLDRWDFVASGVLQDGTTRIDLPARNGGSWLIWLTDLPARDDGEFYYSDVHEVRLLSD